MKTFTALLFTLGVTEPSRPAQLAGRAVGRARGGDDGDVVPTDEDGGQLTRVLSQAYRAEIVEHFAVDFTALNRRVWDERRHYCQWPTAFK